MKLIATDDVSRSLKIDGCTLKLPNKCWQVLQLLRQDSARVVSRQQLIEQVWHGNVFSGEKALTQTIWLLRDALQDDAGCPEYIQTHPGVGYQWIGRQPAVAAARRPPGFHLPAAFAPASSVLLALGMLLISALAWDGDAGVQAAGFQSVSHSTATDGTYAYQMGAKIIIHLPDGQRAVIIPDGRKRFSSPELSADGEYLAVQVTEAGRCSLVVLEFETRQYQKFTGCFKQPMQLRS